MIQITIVTDDGITAIRIAEFLVKENLVINAKLLGKVQQCSKTEAGVIMENKFMLIAITKGALFNLIDTKLKEEFPGKPIEFNAVPIVNMNWEHSEKLASEILS